MIPVKKIFFLILCGITLAVSAADDAAKPLFTSGAKHSPSARVVRVGFFPFPGYHMSDVRGRRSGYGYDYLQYLLPHTAWEYTYTAPAHEWPEMLPMLERGEIDMLTSVQKTPEREKLFAFSQYPMGVSSLIMTVRLDKRDYLPGDYGHWNGIRVGMLRNNSRNEDFSRFAAEKMFTFVPVYYDTIPQLLDDLRNGRNIDAAISSNLRRLHNEVIFERLSPDPFYIVTRKDDFALMDEINYAMSRVENQMPQLQRDLWSKYYTQTADAGLELTDEEKDFVRNMRGKGQYFTAIINPDRAPLSYVENGEIDGFLKDYADEIIRRTGLPVKFRPLKNRQEYLAACEDPKVDIIFDMVQNFSLAEKRRLRLSPAYFTATISLLTNKNHIGELRTVATVEGSDLQDAVLGQLPASVREVNCKSIGDAIQMVASNRCNAAYMFTRTSEKAVSEDLYNSLAVDYSSQEVNYTVGVRYDCDMLLSSIIGKAVSGIDNQFIDQVRKNNQQNVARKYSLTGLIYQHPWIFTAVLLVAAFGFAAVCWYIVLNRRVTYRIGALLAHLPFHCFVIARDGRFLYYNFGMTAKFARVRLRSVADIPGEDIRQLMRSNIATVIETGKPALAEFVFEDRNRAANIYKLPESLFGCETVLWLSQDVTELHDSRLEAQKNEELCRMTLNSVGDGILSTDINGNVQMLNPVAENMIGIKKSEALGRPHDEIFNIVSSVDHVRMDSPIFRTLRTGTAVELANHTELVSLDNSRRYHIADSSAPIRDKDGKLVGAILVFRDVTEEYRHRKEMQNEVARWETVSAMGKIYHFRYNFKTLKVSGSMRLADIWPINDGFATPVKDWVYPEDCGLWKHNQEMVLSGEKEETIFEYRVLQKGKMRYFKIFMKLADDSPECIIGLLQETTEMFEIMSRENTVMKLWQICANSGPAMMFVKAADDDFRYLQCNERFAKFVGLPQEKIVGRTDSEIFNRPEDADNFRAWDMRVMAKGEQQEFFEEAIGGDGETHYISTVKIASRDVEGKPILIGISVDQTQMRKQEAELRELLKSWDSASEIAHVAAYRFNIKTRAMTGTGQLQKFWPVRDGFAVPTAEWVHPDDVEKCDHVYTDILEGKLDNYSFTYRVKSDGGVRYMRQFFQQDPRHPDEFTGLFQDITAITEEQARRENMSKMWQTVVDSVPLLLFVKDADNDYRYLQGNAIMSKFFNLPVSKILGRKMDELVSDKEDCRRIHENDLKVIKSGKSEKIFEDIHDSSGVLHHFQSIKVPSLSIDDHKILIQMSMDITEFQELSEVSQVVNFAFERLFSSEDLEAGVRSILKRVCDFIGFSRGYVCCVDDEKNVVRLFTSYIPDGEKSIFNGQTFVIEEAKNLSWYRAIMESKQNEVFLCDFSDPHDRERAKIHCPRVLESAKTFDVRGIYVNYISVDGKPWGNIGFISQYAPMKKLTANEKKLLNMTAHIIELAVSRYKTFGQLETALRDARAADKAKSFFLASMSHEIRTPLNAVIGFSELLKDKGIDASIHDEYIDGISMAGNALLQLINDILDLSKLEAGQVEFIPEKTDFSAFLRELGAVFQNGANQRNLRLIFEAVDIPEIYIDKQRMRQILFNLIGNALKFTNTGGITVRSRFDKTSDELGEFTLQVIDTGIGISPEDQKKLFQPFVQLSRMRGTNANNTGTGLGLSIVRKMVRQMGGEIALESKIGEGSTFTIVLSNVKYDKFAQSESQKQMLSTGLCPKNGPPKILLVDDAPINLKIMESLLKPLRIAYASATSGAQALEMMEKEDFNIVLTDLLMPEMSGADLSKAIRSNPKFAEIKIGVITAEADLASCEGGLFDCVMPKPITRDALYNYIYGDTEAC